MGFFFFFHRRRGLSGPFGRVQVHFLPCTDVSPPDHSAASDVSRRLYLVRGFLVPYKLAL